MLRIPRSLKLLHRLGGILPIPWSIAMGGSKEELAKLQKSAYPDIMPFYTDMSLEEVFEKSNNIAEDFGWEIHQADLNSGIIEATDTTLLFGFKDDIVVRITKSLENTRVDVRSVSRVGRSDLGANAARIERFLDALRQVKT